MNDQTHNILLGEIKGTLHEFKAHTDRRFDEIKEAINDVSREAKLATQKADEALDISRDVVKRAKWVGTGFAAAVSAFIGCVEYLPRMIQAYIGH